MTILTAAPDKLKSQIKEYGAPHYYLILGDELLLQRETVELITNIACDANGPLQCQEVETFTDVDKYDIEQILMETNQLGLFAIRKLYKFIFNNAPTPQILEDMNKIAKAQDNVHVYMFNFLQWERKHENCTLLKTLESNPGLTGAYRVDCKPLEGAKYFSWIKSRLKAMKFQYDNEAAQLLYELFEHSMFALQQILEQMHMRNIEYVTVEEVTKSAQLSSDYNVSDLIGSLLNNDLAKANYILEFLVFTKKTAPIVIITWLRNELQKIYDLRNTDFRQDSPVTFFQQPFGANGLSKEQHAFLKKKVWDRNLQKRYEYLLVNRINRKWLYECIIMLIDIEIASKTRDRDTIVVDNLKQFFLKFVTNISAIGYELFDQEAQGETLPNWAKL